MRGVLVHIEREIVFPASPAEVWEALTDPERLEEWFASEVELDARPGGVGVFRWGDGDERRAVVREVEQEERLVLDWDDDGQVVLELEEGEGDGARGRTARDAAGGREAADRTRRRRADARDPRRPRDPLRGDAGAARGRRRMDGRGRRDVGRAAREAPANP